MGCGMSRYGLADHLGFQPIRRKIDELRKNDRVTVVTDDAHSTKLLLKETDGGDQDLHAVVESTNSQKSISSSLEDSVKEQTEKKEKSMKVAVGDSAIKKKRENEEVGRKEVVAAERGDDKDKAAEESEQEEEEHGRISDYDGSRISDYDASLWIGSPSFREYCNVDCPSASDDDSIKSGGNSDGEKKESKAKADKGNASPNPNEGGAETKSVRKGRKGRRFRKVFPTGRPSGMKNLLHVGSCYNPRGPASRDNKLGKPIEKTV